jgi:transposase
MVAPHLGLTPRKYQSGQTDRGGRISKYGDAMMRHLLYESATLVLGRLKRPAAVKQWGPQIAERRGLKGPVSRWPANSPLSCIECGSMAPISVGTPRRRTRPEPSRG